MASSQNLSALIWSVADLLRGDFKQSDYGKVILPFTILRRIDCVLEPTKARVLEEHAKRKAQGIDSGPFLERLTGYSFYNTSDLDLAKIVTDPANIKPNVIKYVGGFSSNVGDIFERYEFDKLIDTLGNANLLYLVTKRFVDFDLHPKAVSNTDMGLVFEELIRKFAELSNETAGEHFTPREVIRLMVNLLFSADSDVLTKPGTIRTIYDPAAGTGGMLSVAEEYLHHLNPDAKLVVAGQELNPESYAICKGDMLIKGQDVSKIKFGNTLSEDGHHGAKFDYGLSNPPFGVEWKKVESAVRDEYQKQGFNGRFGPGLPRVSDGSLLFLLHLLSKMQPVRTVNGVSEGGGRVAIVLNGSPLFTGGAGSGESEIRRWIIEQDLLEAIVALPTDMFYNTGISTYIWVLSNHKAKQRKGKIQLINGVDFFQKMRKSLGSKRKELGEADIERITKLYGDFTETEQSKIFDREDFGYSAITVERPLKLMGIDRHRAYTATEIKRLKESHERSDEGEPVIRRVHQPGKMTSNPLYGLFEKTIGGKICVVEYEPDSDLRDTENVPLKDDISEYFQREVLPHVNDAWIESDKTKVGFEIPFARHFYKFVPPRPLEAIDADLESVTKEILDLLAEVTHGR